jgi:hypothetical protein
VWCEREENGVGRGEERKRRRIKEGGLNKGEKLRLRNKLGDELGNFFVLRQHQS